MPASAPLTAIRPSWRIACIAPVNLHRLDASFRSFLQISPPAFHPLNILIRAYEHHFRTLDPLFALLIGFSAAGMRIRREENEKRLGMATTSMVGPTGQKPKQQPKTGSQDRSSGEIGYAEIANMGWGRIKKNVSRAVQW